MVHRRGEEEGTKQKFEDGSVDLEVQVSRLRKRSMVAAPASAGENTGGEEEAAMLAIQENVSQHTLLLQENIQTCKRQ